MAELTIHTGEPNIDRHPEAVPRMVTVNALSGETGISAYAIRKLVKADKITYFKSGSKVLINFDKFIDFLNGEQ